MNMDITKNKLSYMYGNTIEEGTFRINCSSISDYFSNTTQWYNEKVMGEEQPKKYGTALVIGTVLHYVAECHIKGGLTVEDNEELSNYIELMALNDSDIDEVEVRDQVRTMWPVLESYIDREPLALAEPFVTIPTNVAGINMSGSIDGLRILGNLEIDTYGGALTDSNGLKLYEIANQKMLDGSDYTLKTMKGLNVEIIDWKTSSSKTIPKTLTKKYRLQLQAYALILKEAYGINVVKCTNVYITKSDMNRGVGKTGKPLKGYPSILGTVSIDMDDVAFEIMDGIGKLIAESVKTFIKQPELRHIIAQDNRLKGNTTTLPFYKVDVVKDLVI